jgi:glycosyltransferase involved in cell wall biosynthesis
VVPVTVVIPLFNKAPYVGRAIDSILAQTWRELEVIVVDDGSTDDGPAVVAGYADPRLRLVSQPNRGPGAARNLGIRESRSPLVSFLDADDEWLPTFLESALRSLRDNPGCPVAACGYLMGPQRLDCRLTRWGRGVAKGVFRLSPHASPPETFRARNFIFTPGGVVCDKELLLRYEGFYDRQPCRYGEDVYLWTEILLNHPIVRNPEPHLWIHTEASQLGVGRTTRAPVEPLLTDPEPVRRVCSDGYRDTLERLLAWLALRTARKYAWSGDRNTAADLLSRFPRIRRQVLDHFGLQLLIRTARLRARDWASGSGAVGTVFACTEALFSALA